MFYRISGPCTFSFVFRIFSLRTHSYPLSLSVLGVFFFLPSSMLGVASASYLFIVCPLCVYLLNLCPSIELWWSSVGCIRLFTLIVCLHWLSILKLCLVCIFVMCVFHSECSSNLCVCQICVFVEFGCVRPVFFRSVCVCPICYPVLCVFLFYCCSSCSFVRPVHLFALCVFHLVRLSVPDIGFPK